jgi:hypothetical protein
MKLSKDNRLAVSMWLMYTSFIAILFAANGWIGTDIWLASTQWLLVAGVLALFGIYLKIDR